MMTLLNLVQPISCGQSQYLLQALSAHSSYRFSIDTSQGIENHFEGGEKHFLSSDHFTHKCDYVFLVFVQFLEQQHSLR